MPPEQETTIAPNIPPITNRPENTTIHVDPEASITKQSQTHITFPRQKNKSCVLAKEAKVTRKVLTGVTGVASSGELTAMLGPSGSGKTTLLTALAGRLAGKVSGSITYNGNSDPACMKRKIGFVSQDDVVYPHLTVLETLTYAALLRLPKTLSKEEKVEHAERVDFGAWTHTVS
ncbi:P-loop containing nucleoside triphosphate hydrolase [Sesbania bispinosa]|nr:P-loop containing nucleoside triphosphate hydrolase [Sesbania bispinosa]